MNLTWFLLIGILFTAIFLLFVEIWIKVRREVRKKRYHYLIKRKMQTLAQLEKEELEEKPVLLNQVFKESFGYDQYNFS